jgi:uncharacterized protein
MKMSGMDWVVWILLFVGGLNWGFVGAFDFNLVSTIFGDGSALSRIIYVLVGLAAIWSLFGMFKGSSNSSSTPTV